MKMIITEQKAIDADWVGISTYIYLKVSEDL